MADNLISRVYGNFRGVDFRGEEINISRSPDSLNVWKDYKETESIRTRPKMELALTKATSDFVGENIFDETIYGIFFFDYEYSNGKKSTRRFVHSGSKLYEVEATGTIPTPTGVKTFYKKTELCSGVAERRSQAFICNNKWYFLDGKNYLVYETEVTQGGVTGTTIKGKMVEVEGYVPTTSIGRKASGGGTIYEDVNLISDYRKNTFLADGESKDFYLDAPTIDDDFLPEVKVNDVVVTDYTVDYSKGKISFKDAPAKPLTDGQDNVSVKFKKSTSNASKIKNCTIVEVFDNRVFFSGNPYHPNSVWHCSLNDATYISDTDVYNEGLDRTNIRGMVAGNHAILVFKEPSTANTSIFYHTPTLDGDFGKIYPSEHSNVALGCVGGAINFNDDIVFFSQNGAEGITGDITTEQVVSHRSSLVDRKLLSNTYYRDMILVEWEGYLIVLIGNKGYLADSRAKFTNNDHYEYEWFYWEFDKRITSATVYDGVLYLGTYDSGVYTLTDNEGALDSYWVTPKDKFKYPQYQKTTNKRGCVVEATGDISVSVKTDKTDFELIGDYTKITDYFVSRIKRKKFKDIQLKFHSNTRFSLETATLECFIGGYIKR